MPTLLGNGQIKLNDGTVQKYQDGGYYNGQRVLNGKLLAPGEYEPGKMTSNEVIAQSNPANVDYIQAQKLQSAVTPQYTPSSSATTGIVGGLASDVLRARTALDTTLTTQKTAADAALAAAKEKEKSTLDTIGTLSTPFRAELEATQREALHVNQNFEENQQLTDELDGLLTQGNDLIKQQQSVTGLSAIRNPRVQQTISDVTARAGVIQAVMAARNSQITVANNLIDRTVGAINQDRQDQISYYTTILNLNNRDILSLDETSKKLADKQLSLLQGDFDESQKTADFVKEKMLDPATAMLMAKAGVTLNDSVEQINAKVASAAAAQDSRDMSNKMAANGYSAALGPGKDVVTLTDANGAPHYYKKVNTDTVGGNVQTFLDGLKAQDAKVTTSDNKTVVLTADEQTKAMQTAEKLAAPNFNPHAGIGSRYTDALGRQWIYDSTGWRLL